MPLSEPATPGRVVDGAAAGRAVGRSLVVAGELPFLAGALAELSDAPRQVVADELGGDVVADDDRMPVLAVSRAERASLRDVVPVELDVLDRSSEHLLDSREVLACAVAERERLDRIRGVRAVDAFGQLAACERYLEWRALHVGPGVRLVRVAGVEHLLSGRDREPGMDAGELSERLDCSYGDLTGRELALELLGELQDSQVLADAGLGGLQAFGDALEGQAGVDQPLVAAGTGEGIEVPAQVVLEQRFHEEVGLLVVVAGAGGADDRRQLHDAGLDGGAVSALAGDQDVVAVVGRADADRLQAAVGADRVRELLELAIVGHLAAGVEGFGDDYARERDVAELHAAVRRWVDLRPVVGVGCCGGGHVALPCVEGASPGAGPIPDPGHARMACQGGRGRCPRPARSSTRSRSRDLTQAAGGVSRVRRGRRRRARTRRGPRGARAG